MTPPPPPPDDGEDVLLPESETGSIASTPYSSYTSNDVIPIKGVIGPFFIGRPRERTRHGWDECDGYRGGGAEEGVAYEEGGVEFVPCGIVFGFVRGGGGRLFVDIIIWVGDVCGWRKVLVWFVDVSKAVVMALYFRRIPRLRRRKAVALFLDIQSGFVAVLSEVAFLSKLASKSCISSILDDFVVECMA
eukprot:CCRYP_017790-RA/>CCRYP_017790-RA protein AED:0.44 eAED:1.00 QI:0/0/0/1/1/1/2/0/189